MLDFRQITLFCFEYHLLKHKITAWKIWEEHGPLGYAYAHTDHF